MFTGIIEEVGHVAQFEQRGSIYRLAVSAPLLAPQLKTGDSIAVSGVCLTAFDITADGFAADLAEETIARTTLSCLSHGSLVNLELPKRAGTPSAAILFKATSMPQARSYLFGLCRKIPMVPATGGWRLNSPASSIDTSSKRARLRLKESALRLLKLKATELASRSFLTLIKPLISPS